MLTISSPGFGISAINYPAIANSSSIRLAESALRRLQCIGPGLIHRTLVELLPDYFIPPIDDSDRHSGPRQHRRGSKLANAAPIGRGRDLRVRGLLVG